MRTKNALIILLSVLFLLTTTWGSPAAIALSIPSTEDVRTLAGSMPFQITLTLGSKSDEIHFNWLTAPDVTDTRARIRHVGEEAWRTVEGSGYLHFLTEGQAELYSHKVSVTGLSPDTEYEYQVGGKYHDENAWSDIAAFKSLPVSGDEVTVLCLTDVQAEDPRELIPINRTMRFLMEQPDPPDAMLFTGDIVDEGYDNQHWEDFFGAIEPHNSSLPSIFLPGNHEQNGDLRYQQFAARYNLPGGFSKEIDGVSIEGITGWFEVGDACVIAIATILDSKDMQEQFILEQLDWAEKIYEQSGKTWRIMLGHAGPYTIHKKGVDYRPFLNEGCDRLQVDLYFNGHDHMYMRGTVFNDEKVRPGQGTTYITGSAIGWNLFDKYSTKNDPYVEVYNDTKRPMYKLLTITPEKLSVTAYQVAETELKGVENLDFTQWDVVDELVLTGSLSTSANSPVAAPVTTPAADTDPVTTPVTDTALAAGADAAADPSVTAAISDAATSAAPDPVTVAGAAAIIQSVSENPAETPESAEEIQTEQPQPQPTEASSSPNQGMTTILIVVGAVAVGSGFIVYRIKKKGKNV